MRVRTLCGQTIVYITYIIIMYTLHLCRSEAHSTLSCSSRVCVYTRRYDVENVLAPTNYVRNFVYARTIN